VGWNRRLGTYLFSVYVASSNVYDTPRGKFLPFYVHPFLLGFSGFYTFVDSVRVKSVFVWIADYLTPEAIAHWLQ